MIIITLIALFTSYLLTLIFKDDGNRRTKFYFYVSGFLLICISGFRIGDKMPDYATYTGLYSMVTSATIVYLIEPSFIFIAQLANLIAKGEVVFLFLIYAAIGVSLKFIAIKKFSNFLFFSVFIYISNYFILHEMIQIRAGVASALILISLSYSYNRDKKKFIFLILIATFFHFSSIIFLPLWFLKPNSFKKHIYIYLIPLAYIIHFTNLNTLLVNSIFVNLNIKQSYINPYRAERLQINVFGIFIITRIIIFIYFAMFAESIKRHNKYFYILIKFYGIGVFTYIAMASYPEIAVRIAQTLFVSEIIIIPTLIYTFTNKNIAKLAVFFYGLLAFLLNLYFTTYFNYSK